MPESISEAKKTARGNIPQPDGGKEKSMYELRKMRAAGYARVSTETELQEDSYR